MAGVNEAPPSPSGASPRVVEPAAALTYSSNSQDNTRAQIDHVHGGSPGKKKRRGATNPRNIAARRNEGMPECGGFFPRTHPGGPSPTFVAGDDAIIPPHTRRLWSYAASLSNITAPADSSTSTNAGGAKKGNKSSTKKKRSASSTAKKKSTRGSTPTPNSQYAMQWEPNLPVWVNVIDVGWVKGVVDRVIDIGDKSQRKIVVHTYDMSLPIGGFYLVQST